MSEQDLPSGFRPFKKREADPLSAAVEKWVTAMRTTLALAVESGEVELAYEALRRPFNVVVRIVKAFDDSRAAGDATLKAFYELVNRWEARQKRLEVEAFDQSLVKARKLLDFAREAVGGPSMQGEGDTFVSPPLRGLTESAMLDLLALAGIDGEDRPSPLDAALNAGMTAAQGFVGEKLKGDEQKPHVHLVPPMPGYSVPAGAAVEEQPVDSTVVMQVLCMLVSEGLVSEDGEIEDDLWGAVQKAAAAQDAVRRA